jgi:hypothetical protein
VYKRTAYEDTMEQLFDTLTGLRILDLHNAHPNVFRSYCTWRRALQNTVMVPSTALEVLYVGAMPLELLMVYLVMEGINAYSDGSHMALRFVGLSRPLSATDTELLQWWFSNHIFDFRHVVFPNTPLSLLPGPSYHSLCAFVP